MNTNLGTPVGLGLLVALLAIPAVSIGAEVQRIGNVKRGALVAAACQSCHGAQGEGAPAMGYPRLAGQTASYLEKQLRDYVSGLRNNPVMAPLAKAYSEQQRADVAVYYASLAPPYAAPTVKPDRRSLARGRLLARTGDESKQLQACANCHGPDGSGEPLTAPYLVGQSGSYLASTINEWKSGARKNDGGKQMAVVAGRLDEKDTAAVAAYFESLGHADF
jgi:cytochrome c553